MSLKSAASKLHAFDYLVGETVCRLRVRSASYLLLFLRRSLEAALEALPLLGERRSTAPKWE